MSTANDEMQKLYHEEIMKHARKPVHYGLLKAPDMARNAVNASCGDTLSLSISVKDGNIDGIGFEGEGCALSIASASLLAEAVNGMPVEAAVKMIHAFLSAGEDIADFAAHHPEFGCLVKAVSLSTRRTCVHLAWELLREILDETAAFS